MPDRFDSHGYALSDIKDPPEAAARNAPVVTFEAYDRASGEKVILDDRTFDPEQHSLDAIEVAP